MIFIRRWGKRVILATACLLTLGCLAMPAAHAQDDVVIISDSYHRRAAPQIQRRRPDRQVRQVRRTAYQSATCQSGTCESGYCDIGGCETAYCDDGCCDTGCSGSCCGCSPWWAHKSSFSGEFLYLHTTDADVAYAQQQNGIGGAGTVPFGRIGSLAPHHEPGFRAGVTKAFSDSSSLVMSYSFFESDSIDALEPPVIPGGGGAVGSLVHHPGAAITASAGPVNAAYDVDFQLADISYRSVLKANDCYAINWSVGGRYGSLTQDFRQLGIYTGAVGGTIETRSNVDFDGGGLRFGLDGERRLGCSGFSVYSRGNVSTLSGRFHADYYLNNNTTDVLLALADWEDDRIITLLDLEAGLSWTGEQGKWRASAGYLASFWFNTVTTSEFINTVQANSYDGVDDTLKFEGLTARIERRW